MTNVQLLAIGIDSRPEEIRLDVVGGMRIQLAPGVHLDLAKATPEALRELASVCSLAAQCKDFQTLPEVA
ncbi:hypothetical protein ACFYVK_35015 [Streptomyces chartreusis]|uniref:hypothetical protein n=1 Tax=Streptomyces chartreusis TaxID=1969 RepID=UPI0036D006AE